MTRPCLVAALACLALTAPASPAGAGPHESLSFTCGFSLVDDPTIRDGRQTRVGEMDGGPVLLGDGERGSLTCTIQVDGPTHAHPDDVSLTGPATDRVAVVPASAFAITAHRYALLYLCTQVDVEGAPPYYWDGDTGAFSHDPTASCSLAISSGTSFDPVEPIEATFCPVLGLEQPCLPVGP